METVTALLLIYYYLGGCSVYGQTKVSVLYFKCDFVCDSLCCTPCSVSSQLCMCHINLFI